MIWSRYNLIFEKGGIPYLYNSYTNNLLTVTKKFMTVANLCKDGKFSEISDETIKVLQDAKIIVDDDNEIFRRIKMSRLMSRHNTEYMSLTIAPTTGCNFKCSYCYENGIKSNYVKNQESSIVEIINFVTSFKSVKNLKVTWYGGEPLIMFDYIEKLSIKLIELYDNYSAYMITNAYLLDSNKAHKLKNLKISGLQITIDGLEQTHNKRRPHKINSDSFQKIICNLDNLFQIYPEILVSIRINIDKTNAPEYPELYYFLRERYGMFNINVHPGFVTDEFSSEGNNSCLANNEINNFIIDQYDKYSIPISLYPKTSYGECCARHLASFVIGPFGELYKCWNDIGLNNKVIGTISKFSQSNRTNLLYLLDNDPLETDECKECFCFPICNGGCPYSRIFHPERQQSFCAAKRNSIEAFLIRHVCSKNQNNVTKII